MAARSIKNEGWKSNAEGEERTASSKAHKRHNVRD